MLKSNIKNIHIYHIRIITPNNIFIHNLMNTIKKQKLNNTIQSLKISKMILKFKNKYGMLLVILIDHIKEELKESILISPNKGHINIQLKILALIELILMINKSFFLTKIDLLQIHLSIWNLILNTLNNGKKKD